MPEPKEVHILMRRAEQFGSVIEIIVLATFDKGLAENERDRLDRNPALYEAARILGAVIKHHVRTVPLAT